MVTFFMCFPELHAASKRTGAGLVRSTRGWLDLLLCAGAFFCQTRDFFSITTMVCMALLLVREVSLTALTS
jgi:hypothetical protein